MSNTRLTVVVRKDLQMPIGLLAAQVAHMSDAFMRDKIVNRNELEKHNMTDKDVLTDVLTIPEIFSPVELSWMQQPYLSIFAVNCYEDLLGISEHVKREVLPSHKWIDTIPSPTFEGQSINAFVGISIGPADFDKIKIVTSGLDLY